MLGRDVVGQFALTEGGSGVTVQVPSLPLTLNLSTPVTHQFPISPVAALTLALHAPTIRAGKRIDIGALNLTLTLNLPRIEQSATIKVPISELVLSLNTPIILAGTKVLPTSLGLLLNLFAPVIRAGKRVNVPSINTTLTLYRPARGIVIRQSSAYGWSLNLNTPAIRAGARVLVPRTVVTNAGMPPVATEPLTVSPTDAVIKSMRINLRTPSIRAGKRINVPSIHMVEQIYKQEIAARRAAIKVQIINS